MEKEIKEEIHKRLMEIINTYGAARLEMAILSLSNNTLARAVDVYQYINELIEKKELFIISGRAKSNNNLNLYVVRYKENDRKS